MGKEREWRRGEEGEGGGGRRRGKERRKEEGEGGGGRRGKEGDERKIKL